VKTFPEVQIKSLRNFSFDFSILHNQQIKLLLRSARYNLSEVLFYFSSPSVVLNYPLQTLTQLNNEKLKRATASHYANNLQFIALASLWPNKHLKIL